MPPADVDGDPDGAPADEPEPRPPFPLQEFLGFEMVRDGERAHATIDIGPVHHNPNGVAHGAVIVALIDTVMGAAAMSAVPEGSFCATIELHTRFLRPVMEGRVVAEAAVISAGRRVVHLEAKATGADGKLVASATGSFAVITPE